MTPTETLYREHDDAQRLAWAKLSPIERLRWLAQAKAFSLRWRGAVVKASDSKR